MRWTTLTGQIMQVNTEHLQISKTIKTQQINVKSFDILDQVITHM